MRLAGLGGRYSVEPEIRAEVGRRFPHIRVDWEAVDRALTVGPPHEQAATAVGVPNDRLDWLELERRLSYWAALAEPLRPQKARRLTEAAEILLQWRYSRPDFPLEPAPGWDQGLPPQSTSKGCPPPVDSRPETQSLGDHPRSAKD